MGGVCYRSAVLLSGVLLFLAGCAANRLALNVKEPEDRWSLSTLTQTPAPLEQPMIRIFEETIPVWASRTEYLFVTAFGFPRGMEIPMLAETVNLRLVFTSPLNLMYPDPQRIALALNDVAGKPVLP